MLNINFFPGHIAILSYYLVVKLVSSVCVLFLQCKRLVFEYAPIILINAEEFLEKTDVCTLLHACDAAPANSDSMHAAS